MSSFEPKYIKLLDLIEKDICLNIQLFQCSTTSTMKFIIDYLDRDLKKMCNAATLIVRSQTDWSYKFNPEILQDGNICKFNEWLLYNDNADWLLLNDTTQKLIFDDLNIEYNKEADIKNIKIGIRALYHFRRILRDKLHIYMREYPFILINQYFAFIRHYLNEIVLIQTNIDDLQKLIQWLDKVYSNYFPDKLNAEHDEELDELLLKIKPDLIDFVDNYSNKSMHSKELIS